MGTHFSSGVTNVFRDADMGALRTMSPKVYYEYKNDFYNYTAADWVVTETDSGSTEAIVAGAGGWLAITNVSAGATDAAQLQWAGGSGAALINTTWNSAKDYILNTSFKVDSVANTSVLIGLATVDTTVVASLPTNGIYFYKVAGATVTPAIRGSGTSTTFTANTMADDTFADMTLAYTAVDGTWRSYFNGNLTGQTTTLTNCPTASLCLSIGLLNASAAAHVLTVDYLNVFVQR